MNVLAGTDLPNTANFNTAYEGTLDRTAVLYAGRVHPGQNWHNEAFTTSSFGSNSQILATSWDPLTRRWIVLVCTPITSQPFVGYGLDDPDNLDTWIIPGNTTFGGSASPNAGAVCADPATAGNIWAAIIPSTGTTGVAAYLWNGTTWTQEDAIADSYNAGFRVEMIPFTDLSGNKRLIYVYGSTSSGKCLVRSALASAPSTWTTVLAPVNAHTNWRLKSGGPSGSPMAILMPRFAGSEYYTSPDGVTWTQRTWPFSDEVAGLTWNGVAQAWFAATTSVLGSPYTNKIYTSSDGVTWTQMTTTPSSLPTAYQIADLASVANALVVVLADGSATLSSSACATWFSPDLGGTWCPCQAVLDANMGSGATGYHLPALAEAPTQLVLFNTQRIRLSLLHGMPPHL